ncbi:mutS2 protein [Clostridium sp. CAG:798]|jgi:DNA mismatch repair protein MutS2|nr:mutS2 protein [Clostridium sp. CAG:798]
MLDKLEYSEIIKLISNYCKTYIGKETVLKLSPCFDSDEVSHLLEETTEAMDISIKKSNIPVCEIPNIDIWIKQLESTNVLSAKALIDVATILKVSRELKEFFFKDPSFNTNSFSILFDYFNSLYVNKNIESTIFEKILDENTIADNASPKLSSIRKNKKKAEQAIRDKLDSIIHSSSYSKYLMEPIVTIRNDRFVIPLKQEYRNMIKGFIHDISSSGSTVYIEPLAIFEINNEINNLKIEENIEIEKILQNLSILLYKYTNELKNNVILIGKLDVLSAKVLYSKSIDGIKPTLNTQKYINLIAARHPLIDKNNVVPINIALGKNFNSLIITGPNTGGKTVSLKTTGLLLLMAYTGLYIPCNENSSICVFKNIFADIGDEQSISESLSTFSSHMTNIINITNNANENSLILLDELGSGTDPIEGANLAISILNYFYNMGCLVISTTHYQELKNYALITDGFENASSEFDIENLRPTYKLLIGIPGKSNAFAISQKLGLKQEILDNAYSLLKDDNIHIEDILKNIYDNKIQIEYEKQEIDKNLMQIQNLRKELEKENKDVKQKEQELIENAELEAREIILTAKDEVNEIIKKLNNINGDLKTANNLRNTLNDKLKQFDVKKIENGNLEKKDIQLGMLVEVIPFNATGTVISLPNKSNEVQIQIGNTKMNISLSNLNKTKKTLTNENFSTTKVNRNNGSKSKYISPEINVIGQNVDEAIYIIDKYLDDCTISNISPIRIVHGKGTGKLREGIHAFLKKHPHVKSFRLGTFGEGEMGVTVVELT